MSGEANMDEQLQHIVLLLQDIRSLLENLNGYAAEEYHTGYDFPGTRIHSGDKAWKEKEK